MIYSNNKNEITYHARSPERNPISTNIPAKKKSQKSKHKDGDPLFELKTEGTVQVSLKIGKIEQLDFTASID